ncbi:hypothetical protein CEXT_344861 [Caerostris extrusa]|uniref:Uncharacterized protein n=1 Tax=Caerostris extrusa TaxID=172846 RepID=A0AAV4UB75_CAEEX|nr:hypothetical protein CEXT_344861 [Caerostris extrusa]
MREIKSPSESINLERLICRFLMGNFKSIQKLPWRKVLPFIRQHNLLEETRCDIIFFSVIAAFKGNEWKYISLGEVNSISFRAETNCVWVSQQQRITEEIYITFVQQATEISSKGVVYGGVLKGNMAIRLWALRSTLSVYAYL